LGKFIFSRIGDDSHILFYWSLIRFFYRGRVGNYKIYEGQQLSRITHQASSTYVLNETENMREIKNR